jgi:hypothetical protein
MCGHKSLPRTVGAKNAPGIMEVMEISLEETATIAEFACELAHSSVDLLGIYGDDHLSRCVIELPHHKDVYTQLV